MKLIGIVATAIGMLLVIALGVFCFATALGCPTGAQTSIEASVTARVDPEHCKEAREDVGGATILLDCAAVAGTGILKVTFPRRAWWDMKAPHIDAGPGK